MKSGKRKFIVPVTGSAAGACSEKEHRKSINRKIIKLAVCVAVGVVVSRITDPSTGVYTIFNCIEVPWDESMEEIAKLLKRKLRAF